MTNRESQRVAIVTGAARGIGAAIARRLAESGFAVVVNYVQSAERAEALAREITASGGRAVAIRADVSLRPEAHALVAKTMSVFGRIDVLVNNAGIGEFAPLDAIREDSFERQYRINVGGSLWCTQAAVAQFGKPGGRIINISSEAADQGPPTSSLYAASKAALELLTRALANELGPKGVTVNAVSPGPIETELYHREMEPFFLSRTPLGRIGQPQDVAHVVAFLASDEAGWVTGQIIKATGGYRC